MCAEIADVAQPAALIEQLHRMLPLTEPGESMPVLFRDYETRSRLDPRKVGAWKYATHSTTDIWCCAFAVDDGSIKLWIPGDPTRRCGESFCARALSPCTRTRRL